MRIWPTVVLALLTGPAWAEAVPLGRADPADPAVAELTLLRSQMNGLEGFVPLPEARPVACDPSRRGVTRAVLVAPTNWGTGDLHAFQGQSTVNDAEFIRNALVSRGADPANLHLLTDDLATHAGVSAALGDLAAAAGCGDSVILHFSTFAFGPDQIAAAHGPGGPFSTARKVMSLAQMGVGFMQDWGEADWIIASGPFLVLNRGGEDKGDVLSAAALSEVVTALRNRGADVAVILDVVSSEAFALEDRQARADTGQSWRDSVAPDGGAAPPATATPSPLSDRAGRFSVFYGTERGNDGEIRNLPRGAPGRKPYGVFSFNLGSALLQSDRTTAAALMRHLKSQETRQRQTFTFVATDPDHDLVVEGRPEIPVQEGAIRILDPAPTRAAAALEVAEITLRGRVEAPAETLIVTVNGRVADSDPGGDFSARLELEAGVNRIDILAMTRDSRPVTHSFELYYEGDMQALVGTGTRYALLIANQDYPAGSGLTPLRTPIADATALAEILTRDYGFVTEATAPDGRPVPLFLQNATRMQIEATLHDLSRIAGERDQVLIFYAGHGIYEAATDNAYWLPVDARAGLPFSYLPASAITDAILRIGAGSILVISDSCYSGALLRGDPVAEGIEGDRLRALQRLAAKRSRVAISSGANEPVADGGGDGHSVFARALLTGLQEMDDDAFTARELFDDYLLPMVVGRAAQEPQYRPIERSGHEGGDAVLVRAGG